MKSFGLTELCFVLVLTSELVQEGDSFLGLQSSITLSGAKKQNFPHHPTLKTAEVLVTPLPVSGGILRTTRAGHATSLTSTADGTESIGEGTASSKATALDTGAIFRYAVALIVQMCLMTTLLKGLDVITGALNMRQKVPFAGNVVFFFFLALKSRVFNPLSNARPRPQTREVEDGSSSKTSSSGISEVDSSSLPPRKMPTWTPPGFVFPIVWILIIGPLRAVSSSLAYRANGGVYADAGSILWLMLHLSVGDVWNTVNNVERRYGTSFVGVVFVWLSAAFAARRYFEVAPLAGRLLSVPLVWLTVASSLIFRTWQLNPDPATGRPASLLPTCAVEDDGTRAKTVTKLIWFEK